MLNKGDSEQLWKSYNTWGNAEKRGGDEYQSGTTEIFLFLGVPIQKVNHCKVYAITSMPAPTNKKQLKTNYLNSKIPQIN